MLNCINSHNSHYSLRLYISLTFAVLMCFAVTKSFSQPTQRGHIPLRYMLPVVGAGGGLHPLNPCLSVPFMYFRYLPETSSTQKNTLAKKGSSR